MLPNGAMGAMHETRNFVLVIALIVGIVWGVVAWFVMGPNTMLLDVQRAASVAVIVVFTAWLLYALKIEDKLPNHLQEVVGKLYFEADGISFMPIVRANGDRAELSLYYQNRFENPAEAIVHLRPPQDSFLIRSGMRDVHIAFMTDGGDFGVIHQPIAVPTHLQGQVVEVQLAAASYYPRSHGARWRRGPGMACGTLLVDWRGGALKTGVHEVSGELELVNPVILHLSMPAGVRCEADERDEWTQKQLVAGPAA